jgi:hypothetical protein
MGGDFVGSASIGGAVSLAIPWICMKLRWKSPSSFCSKKHGSDQPGDAGLVGEDADGAGPPF